MIAIDEQTTIGDALVQAAGRYGALPLLAAPANAARAYHPEGCEWSFTQVLDAVQALAARYAQAGYGAGHRVALLLESRPEHMLHKLALNSIGVCCVPVNPDYRAGEFAYLLDHSRVDLLVALQARDEQVVAALAQASHRPATVAFEAFEQVAIPRAPRPAPLADVNAQMPASILYTSGTTGRPKGCVLSHRYELVAGRAYASRGGLATIREGLERVYNPLPLFHVNASILSFFGVLLTGSCQIQSDRFQPSRFWDEVRQSRASVVHYLGVVIPMLLSCPESPADRQHEVRFGFGAGVEPQLHAVFEQRFGFPLIELWGMTEMVHIITDCHEPRQVGTRAFGRPPPDLEVKVVDGNDEAVPPDTPGEMLIRHSAATPRKDFFSGYLDDPQATEAAWRGGWFHTGDVVRQDASGMLHFVDRSKNIIRRSGENIAAAEVEALLLTHPKVLQAAVMAVADEVREEEVLACVALREPLDDGQARQAVAEELFEFCNRQLAYYKAPGWMWFANEIPTTGTQKIQKHAIFPGGVDPREQAGIIDLRQRKRRG